MSSSETNSVVILGAGVIGLSTAYYLSELSPNTSIHLVDTSPTLFASASGKAAGFLARDWFSPPLSSLGALSFDLHKSLAEAHDGANQWAYSPSTGLSIADPHTPPTGKRGEDWLYQGTTRALAASAEAVPAGSGVPKWLAVGRGLADAKVEKISDGETTAQLDPLQLCQFLLKQCNARNIQIHHPATPTALITSPSNKTLTGLSILSSTTGLTTTLPCTHLLLAAGVWTPSLFSTLFPTSSTSIPVTPLSGHSLVLRSPHWSPTAAEATTGVHAVFTTYPSLNFSPEIFSRSSPNGHGYDLYLAGLNTSSVPIAPLATDVHPIDSELALLLKAAQKLLDKGDDDDDEEEGGEGNALGFEVIQKGFCHRPVTPRGVPLLCALGAKETGLAGAGKVFVCAGHGPWGISLSLGTGLVLAEMMLGRELSADVSQLGL